MRIIGFAGWSGSGKTTLIVKLIPVLRAHGLSVSTVKHAHHNFDVDKPGKDSYEHRMAGATEVLVASDQRFALMHELRGAPEPSIGELLGKLAPVDLVLIEGFKRDAHVKLEVHRTINGKPLLYPDDPHIRGIVSDFPAEDLPAKDLPPDLLHAHIDDIETVATLVQQLATPWPR